MAEIGELISKLHTETENISGLNKYLGKRLYEPVTSSELDNMIFIHDPLSDRVKAILETKTRAGSSPECWSSELFVFLAAVILSGCVVVF